jgi:quercetin dioxygenase-like cupin family protein
MADKTTRIHRLEEGRGFFAPREEVAKARPTDHGPSVVRVVHETECVRCLSVEICGTVPLHYHPDGTHRNYVISGRLRFTIGAETREVGPGDFLLVPRGVPHKVELAGEGPASLATVDTPPIDVTKSVWLEDPPGKAASSEALFRADRGRRPA